MERAAEKRMRQKRTRRILGGICLIALMLIVYGVWEYYARLPPAISSGKISGSTQKGSAPIFSLRDVAGTQFSLDQHVGKTIVVHFMAVGCYGQIYPVNQERLNQLKAVCSRYCGKKPFAMVTVAVATCENSELQKIRTNYGISWALGNDYDDKKMDIVEAYVNACSIKDGAIVVIDKAFNIAEVYNEAVTADKLSIRISQLLEA
jgi:peroxiredoxin